MSVTDRNWSVNNVWYCPNCKAYQHFTKTSKCKICKTELTIPIDILKDYAYDRNIVGNKK